MALNATLEIFTRKFWDIDPNSVAGLREQIRLAVTTRSEVEREKHFGEPYFLSSTKDFSEKIYAGDAGAISRMGDFEEDDIVVNILQVEGPILRNGDACSYGSRNYRDWLLKAMDVPQCVAHVIYINTPGGSAASKDDFRYAIDKIRAKGQPVIALVDGLCASAGYALACLCDEIYFINPKDEVGSIGTMCAAWITPPDAQNTITQDKYVELYATKSPFKNKEVRDAAVGNMEELQKELDELTDEFHEMVRTYRPKVKPEQMEGRLYKAEDVIGTLVDGQSTLQGCIERALFKAGITVNRSGSQNQGSASAQGKGAAQVAQTTATAQTEKNTQTQVGDETEQTVVTAGTEYTHNSKNPKSQETMKKYSILMATLGLAALESDKTNGVYLNEALADTLEEQLNQHNQTGETLTAKMQEIASLNGVIAQLKADHTKALSDAMAAQNAAIEALKLEQATALQTEKDAHAATQTKLDEALQTVSTQAAELVELSKNVVPQPQPAADAPEGNGLGAKTATGYEVTAVTATGSLDDQVVALKKRKELLESRYNA